jgi:hypothetical protein
LRTETRDTVMPWTAASSSNAGGSSFTARRRNSASFGCTMAGRALARCRCLAIHDALVSTNACASRFDPHRGSVTRSVPSSRTRRM